AFGVEIDASALDSSEAQGRAQQAIAAVESDMVKPPTPPKFLTPPATPEQRIAAGDMLFRTKDYDRAIDTLEKVVELRHQGKASEAAFADASFLLSESYFQSHQYLSARRHYRDLVDNGSHSPYDNYAGRAVSRLVDIALRTDVLPSLDFVFERLARLP